MLKEKEDYYVENGFWVFTEQYHKRRGFCCGTGCRHCPYAPKNKRGSTLLKKMKKAST
ncbi:MAG: DUF5522 domain-containing protein [Bacteroidia bacterium]|jgi:hypothetical protein|nr:DUF5522 domain-containing protein [Bacteroidia bacterium]